MGMSAAHITIWCDKCHRGFELALTAAGCGGWYVRHLDSELEDRGWAKANGLLTCDVCLEKQGYKL